MTDSGIPREVLEAWQDPIRFCADVYAPEDQPVGFQVELLRLAAAKRSVACIAPRGAGKTEAATIFAQWYAVLHPDTWTLIVAPIYGQVGNISRPFRHRWQASRLPKVFPHWEVLQDELRTDVPTWGVRFVSAETGAARLEGVHGRKGVLVIYDEAKEVPDSVYISTQAVTIGRESRTLAVTTPGAPSGWLYEAFTSRRPDWDAHVIVRIEDVPHLAEKAEEMRRKLGSAHPAYLRMYEGQFTSETADSFYPYHLIDAAIGKRFEDEDGPVIFGVDPARHGADLTAVAIREGRTIKTLVCWQGRDLMYSVGKVVSMIREHQPHPTAVICDGTGLGAGFVDRLREVLDERGISRFVEVVDFIAGGAAPREREHFQNAKTFVAFEFGRLLERGEVSLPTNDPKLVAQLCSYQQATASNGRLRIVDPPGRSPDRADAVLLTHAADFRRGSVVMGSPRSLGY